jgi:DNA-binding transcriptional LysR family regulator
MFSNVQDLDLKLLRVFRAVARHGGFVAAQTELGLSLPTISNQIKQLEERIGARLCERGAVGFRLTGAGQGLIKATDQLFGAVEAFRAEVADLAGLPVGEVRLGVVDNLATDPGCRLPEAIAALQARAPGAAVRFVIGPPSDLESQVLGGALDLAIGLFPEPPAALDSAVLFHEAHALYCAADHPLFERAGSAAVEEIRQAPYVSWSYLEAYVGDPDGGFLPRSSTPFMEGVAYLVLSGRYIGYLPRAYAERWVRAGRLRELTGAAPRMREVTLIARSSQRSNKLVSLFREEILRAHAAAAPAAAASPTLCEA